MANKSKCIIACEHCFEVCHGVVSHVVDGDTFDIIINENRDSRIITDKIRVRLADINAPEVRGVDSRAGKESANFTRDMLLNKVVYLDIDSKNGMDKYNRWVVVCYIGNDNFNKMMVDRGFAKITDYKDNEFDPEMW